MGEPEEILEREGEPIVYQEMGQIEPILAEVWERKQYKDEPWTFFYSRVLTKDEIKKLPPDKQGWMSGSVQQFVCKKKDYKPLVAVFESMHRFWDFIDREANFGAADVEVGGLNWDMDKTKWRAFKIVISHTYLRPNSDDGDWKEAQKQSDREYQKLLRRAVECSNVAKNHEVLCLPW